MKNFILDANLLFKKSIFEKFTQRSLSKIIQGNLKDLKGKIDIFNKVSLNTIIINLYPK